MNDKLETISNLFEGKEIRSTWDEEKEEYYFSIVDVIKALTDSKNPRDYWYRLKVRMAEEEKSELSTKCRQLRMKSRDGKMYLTDTLDTEGILRLIESVPSPKAEPFKLWLAKLGKERIDEIFDPSIALERAIEIYRSKGYDEQWIEKRIKALQERKQLTDVWKEGGVKEGIEFAILTNEIYKMWSGMTANEYKQHKGLRKESLRDNMDGLELILTDLSEEATKRLAQKKRPQGLNENIDIARKGGHVAKVAREDIEKSLGESIVSKNNKLSYKYIEEKQIIENSAQFVTSSDKKDKNMDNRKKEK